MEKEFSSLADIWLAKKQKPAKKPPAYDWQDLALTIIKDLAVPGNKRNSVFKACKENSRAKIMAALNDTKELCQTGEKWKYFFKILAGTAQTPNSQVNNPEPKGDS